MQDLIILFVFTLKNYVYHDSYIKKLNNEVFINVYT